MLRARRNARRGFSLLELLAVVVVAAIILLASFYSPQVSTTGAVRNAATAFRMSVQSHRAQALIGGEDFVLTLDPGGGTEGRGRWAVQRVASGEAPATLHDSSWTSLQNGTLFSVGSATIDPNGNPIGTAVPRIAVACDGGITCDLGGNASAAFYLSHIDDPATVWAVVITADGNVTQLVWRSALGAWE